MKSKLFYLFVSAAIIFNSNVYSQHGIALKLGVEGGINLANVSRSSGATTNSKTGIIAGGLLDIGISKSISVVPGIYYIGKGWSDNYTDENGNTVTETIKLNYIEIPLLLKLGFSSTAVKPYFFAGPQIAVNLSAVNSQTGGISPSSTDVSSNISGTDLGVLLGSGIEFAANKKLDLFAKFGYAVGLSNIFKNSPTNESIKNNGIHITAGIMIGI